jgi:hypothetical protein
VWWYISKYLLLQVSHLPTKHYYHYYSCCLVGVPLLLLAAVTIVVKKRKSTVLHIFILFCFIDDDSEFDGKGNSNDDGNGYVIDHCLFYESDKTIVGIIYFSFFS